MCYSVCFYHSQNRKLHTLPPPSTLRSAITKPRHYALLTVCIMYVVHTRYPRSTAVASLDFTSRSSDYVLSKTGFFFSTKLSLSLNSAILQDEMQQINNTQNHHNFLAIRRNHVTDFYSWASKWRGYESHWGRGQGCWTRPTYGRTLYKI